MRRVIPLELVGYEKLEYDLYDEKGEIIYNQGDELKPEFIYMLNCKKVYRKESKDPLGASSKSKKSYGEFETVISKKAADSLVKSTKQILKVAFEGDTPDLSVCASARDTIVQEVGDKLDDIDCIGQLRIFDEYTYSHTINVSTLSSALGLSLGLPENEVKDLAMGALLHDIGKMLVPKAVLNKPDKLDKDEFDIMKSHTLLGYQLITKDMKLPDKIAKVALEHQEKYGGSGYPNGLKGKEISLYAQIASIADVYDALVSKRVYKQAMLSHDALKIMLSEGSVSFNPFMLYKFVYLANYKDATNLVIKEEDKL